jgi:predicted glycosyltransferase
MTIELDIAKIVEQLKIDPRSFAEWMEQNLEKPQDIDSKQEMSKYTNEMVEAILRSYYEVE